MARLQVEVPGSQNTGCPQFVCRDNMGLTQLRMRPWHSLQVVPAVAPTQSQCRTRHRRLYQCIDHLRKALHLGGRHPVVPRVTDVFCVWASDVSEHKTTSLKIAMIKNCDIAARVAGDRRHFVVPTTANVRQVVVTANGELRPSEVYMLV